MAIGAGLEAIAEAAARVRAGGMVGMPTETVYGLACDATNGDAVARVYAAKGRPAFNPLIIHVADLEAARALVEMTAVAERLALAFWPGPLTLVLPARRESPVAGIATAGLETIAIRVPSHPVAQELLAACGRPLAAPSANRSGRISPTQAWHVAEEFAGIELLILEGGACEQGVESTIIDCSRGDEVVLLRPGAISRDRIEALVGAPLAQHVGTGSKPSAPGQLMSHYAPRAKVRLNATRVEPGEGLLAFGPSVPESGGPVVHLSATGDTMEAARNLFSALRELDATGVRVIAVMPIPAEGLGEAIIDRLQRAAADRGIGLHED